MTQLIAAVIILYHVKNSSDVIGHFLRCLSQIRTCSISLARRVLDLALRKILCKLFSLRCVALRTLRTLRA